MTSYEELTPDQREQVDAFISNISPVLYWPGYGTGEVQGYVREHASNLVLSCLSIEKTKVRTRTRGKR